MGEDRERVGRYVERRRAELDLSQRQLADLAGVDVKTVYNLEKGDVWPQARTRHKIEQALGWHAGAMDRVATATPEPAPGPEPPRYAEVWAQKIWEIDELSPGERRLAIGTIKALRRERDADHDSRQRGSA